MATRHEIAKSVAILAASVQVELDEPLLESYGIALADVEAGVLQAAVLEAVKADTPFLLKPGQLLQSCERIRGKHMVAAIEAWEEFKHFGRGNELTAAIANKLQYEPHTPEFYEQGRKQFLGEYVGRLRKHGGNLTAAINEVKLLAAPEAKN